MAETVTAPVSAPATPTAATTETAAAPKAAAPKAAAPATEKAAAPAAADVKKAEAVAAEKKEAARRLKLKIDGQEHDLSEEEVMQLASLSAGAQKRFSEAAALRKQAEEAVAYLKANPAEAMKKLGLDPRKFSEEFLVDALKREAESPEQKKVREYEEKIRSYETAEKQRQEAAARKAAEDKANADRAAQEAKTKEIAERYEKVFIEALEKSGLEKNAYTIKRMAEFQKINRKMKLDLTPDSLAKLVKEDVEKEVVTTVKDRTGDQLMELLGPDLIKRITKAQIAKLKGAPQKFAQNQEVPAGNVQNEQVDPNAPKSWRDIRRRTYGVRG
jgi:hypothetical protein